MSGYADIVYCVSDPVAEIRLNRPKQLNAFTYETLREIRSAVHRAAHDARVVVILITGTGRGFSAGLDSQVLADVTANAARPDTDAPSSENADNELPGIFSYLLHVPKPIIACVNGVTAGGGLILALMSDLRFAARSASFTTVFLRRGLIAEHGASWILPRLVGVSRSLDLLWMSDRVDATQALELGLVDRVCDDGELLPEARAYAARLAERVPPAAVAETKRLVYRHLGCGYEQALREADVSQNRFVAAPDALEGARAFLDKRAPEFMRLGRSD